MFCFATWMAAFKSSSTKLHAALTSSLLTNRLVISTWSYSKADFLRDLSPCRFTLRMIGFIIFSISLVLCFAAAIRFFDSSSDGVFLTFTYLLIHQEKIY